MEIAIKNVSMTYPSGKKALKNIELEIKSPTLIGLLGPNGAGKTTLMKLITAGLIPTAGEIFYNGGPLLRQEKQLKSKLGYLPQSFGLYDELSVYQFLDYMSALKNIRNEKIDIERVINETNLGEKKNAKIKTLSGGQRQRVGIAQALLGEPELLIFDEPTVGLDPEERIHFRNLFSKTAQNKAVLLSTHIIEDVQSVCNKLIVMNGGEVLFAGTPEKLIALAQGHVGVFYEDGGEKKEEGYHVTSRINTASGIKCRIVSKIMPSFAEMVEPTLEDAYLYCIAEGGGIYEND